jgi:hypothetical protein
MNLRNCKAKVSFLGFAVASHGRKPDRVTGGLGRVEGASCYSNDPSNSFVVRYGETTSCSRHYYWHCGGHDGRFTLEILLGSASPSYSTFNTGFSHTFLCEEDLCGM